MLSPLVLTSVEFWEPTPLASNCIVSTHLQASDERPTGAPLILAKLVVAGRVTSVLSSERRLSGSAGYESSENEGDCEFHLGWCEVRWTCAEVTTQTSSLLYLGTRCTLVTTKMNGGKSTTSPATTRDAKTHGTKLSLSHAPCHLTRRSMARTKRNRHGISIFEKFDRQGNGAGRLYCIQLAFRPVFRVRKPEEFPRASLVMNTLSIMNRDQP